MGKWAISTEERFWNKINKNGPTLYLSLGPCWVWNAATYGNGYGAFWDGNNQVLAHRFSYAYYNDDFDTTLSVLHKCDNPPCVNPEHLFQGTHSDNMKDAVSKGRHKHNDNKGNRNGRAKLTWEQVNEIRKLLSTGMFQYEIATLFNVGATQISEIYRNESWKC